MMKPSVEIDPGAGPCWGVRRAIQMAEELLLEQEQLACLGDLIHNDEEIMRLESKGLHIVTHCLLPEQSGQKLLLRAHGEPPSTFRIATNFGIELIDATCPIIKKMQKEIAEASKRMREQNGQVILFGDLYHAEVMALKGYCSSEVHIVNSLDDLGKLKSDRPTVFISQSTKNLTDYHKIIKVFQKKRKKEKALNYPFEVVDSTCRYVAKRDEHLIDFLNDKDVLVFVSGRNSSNGKYLFDAGKKNVKASYFIANTDEIQLAWFKAGQKIGISGAASTPLWLLEDTKAFLEELLK